MVEFLWLFIKKNDEVGFEKGSYMSNITGMGVRAGIIGALDIFRGIIVRGNIKFYAAIIALAFSNVKEKRKSWSCLCSPRSNGSKAMG